MTLKSLTMYGKLGSALPTLTFSYTDAHLTNATNGIGGSVSFAYEHVTTAPLYIEREEGAEGCAGLRTSTDISIFCRTPTTEDATGHVFMTNVPGTIPLYFGEHENEEGCSYDVTHTDLGIFCSTAHPQIIGYVYPTQVQGTVPLYYGQLENTDGACSSLITTSDRDAFCSRAPTLLGYVYGAKIDRYRVTSRTVSDGLGWSSSTDFQYTTIGQTVDGKDFRGHAQVRSIDPLDNYTDTFFHQDDARHGRISQTEVHDSTGALFNEVLNTWSTSTPFTGVTFAFLSRADSYECEGQTTCHQHAQTFTYDTNGNPTQSTSLGDVSVNGDERSAVTDWAVDTANWIHRPTHSALYDNAGTLMRERWLYYDNASWGVLDSRGLLTKEESRLTGGQGNAGNPTIVHAYDAYGNQTSTTDPRGCQTTIVYDSSQTFPQTVTNCLGHQASMVYDPGFGVMTSRTNPYKSGDPVPTTTWVYDEFGRVIKVTGPLDTSSTYGTVTYQYLDVGNPSLQRVKTLRTEQNGTANAIWSEQYFDGLGRGDQTHQEGPNGQVIVSELDFDALGRVSQRSVPHFTTETPVWTLFSYDALGRSTRTDHSDGTFAQLVYDHDEVTSIDENGNTKRYFMDAYDRTARVEEVNGAETYTTTYQYDGAGSLTRVTDHLGHQTTMLYDYLGRKISMTDPNMGTWTYGYDKGGNLTSQTDAKNQTITFTYDLLSRVLTKSYPNGQHCDWTYDDPAVANSKGRLTRVVDLAATTKFFYDVLGRVTQTQRILNTTTYTMSQSYDALNRITSETFPDNDSVTYSYNEAGWLSSVPGYISNIGYNARGQKTQLVYSNGITTNWTYNAQNFRLVTRITGNVSGTVQNFTYGYDNLGNITGITDGVYTGGRSFTYDALNRLASATGNFGPNQSLTNESYVYDAVGNILQKGNVVYSYADPLHPSAVTSTSDGKNYSYDANGNMVTRPNQTLTWDYDNRVTALTITGGGFVNSKYDYTGTRVEKDSNLGSTLFPFQGYRIEPNGVIVKNIRIGIETFAVKRSTGEKFFYHNDHLGGVNVITDVNGLVAQLVEYNPWGKTSRLQAGAEGLLRFTGQEEDVESGLLYYGGRYYDPELGRFISPDPFIPATLDPQSFNRYSYVGNNPVNYIDPSGYFHRHHKSGGFLSSFIGIVIGAIVGAITGGIGSALVLAADATISASSAAVFGASFGATFGSMAGIGVNGGLDNPSSIASVFTAGLSPLFAGDLFGSLLSGGSAGGGSGGGGAGGGVATAILSQAGEGGFISPTLLASAAAAGNAATSAVTSGFSRTAGDDESPWHVVFATREGLVGGRTSSGRIIREDSRFVALPDRSALNMLVEVRYNGKSVIAPVWDVGPWSEMDPYWASGHNPLAESGVRNPYVLQILGGSPKNRAGIDLSNQIARDLRIKDGGWIVWRFVNQ